MIFFNQAIRVANLYFGSQFIGLAGEVLTFMTSQFLSCTDSTMTDYLKASLGETHMATLASIIKELDNNKPEEGMFVHFVHVEMEKVTIVTSFLV